MSVQLRWLTFTDGRVKELQYRTISRVWGNWGEWQTVPIVQHSQDEVPGLSSLPKFPGKPFKE